MEVCELTESNGYRFSNTIFQHKGVFRVCEVSLLEMFADGFHTKKLMPYGGKAVYLLIE